MNILLLGSGGQVGAALAGTLGSFAKVTPLSRAALDVGDLDALRGALREARPDVVVNASAYTDVDAAEREEPRATRVNGDAVGLMGEECRRMRAGLVHYSTDFVFDGKGARAYREDDATAPLGAYGRSKLAGERALAESGAPAVVLRTAWVYATWRKSFVSAILRLAREREALRIVADQTGSPTFAGDLAVATALMLHGMQADPFAAIDEARGVYHVAGGGQATRFELAVATLESDPRKHEHKVRTMEPIATSEYPLPAQRPAFAPLDCAKFRARFGLAMPEWREALGRALRR
jgi:dTDP-4-dehydrorhamnose reductase